MNFDIDLSTIAGAGVGLTFLAFVARKWFVSWVFDNTHLSSTAALSSHFTSLQEAIDSNKLEINALRTEQQRMDRVVHYQQRTITRMEMLLRQFSGLMQEKGISVPVHLQVELTDLLKADVDKMP